MRWGWRRHRAAGLCSWAAHRWQSCRHSQLSVGVDMPVVWRCGRSVTACHWRKASCTGYRSARPMRVHMLAHASGAGPIVSAACLASRVQAIGTGPTCATIILLWRCGQVWEMPGQGLLLLLQLNSLPGCCWWPAGHQGTGTGPKSWDAGRMIAAVPLQAPVRRRQQGKQAGEGQLGGCWEQSTLRAMRREQPGREVQEQQNVPLLHSERNLGIAVTAKKGPEHSQLAN